MNKAEFLAQLDKLEHDLKNALGREEIHIEKFAVQREDANEIERQALAKNASPVYTYFFLAFIVNGRAGDENYLTVNDANDFILGWVQESNLFNPEEFLGFFDMQNSEKHINKRIIETNPWFYATTELADYAAAIVRAGLFAEQPIRDRNTSTKRNDANCHRNP